MISQIHELLDQPGADPQRFLKPLALVAVAVCVCLVVLQGELLAIGVLAAAAAALLIFVRPDLATLAFVFVLFSNAVVVAIRSHGVPSIAAAGVVLLLMWPLSHYLLIRREPIVLPHVFWLVLLFTLIQLVSAAFSVHPDLAARNVIVSVAEGAVLFFLVTNVVRTPQMLRRTVWTLLTAGALLGALGLFQQLTQTHDSDYGGFAQIGSGVTVAVGHVQEARPRLAGPIGVENRYAHLMLLLVPLGLFEFLGRGNRWVRTAALLATACVVVGITLTYSRSASISLGVILAAMVALKYLRPRYIVAVGLAAVLMLAVFPQYASRLSTIEQVRGLFFETTGTRVATTDSAIKGRANEALTAAFVFASRPLLGVGPGMFPYHYEDYRHRGGSGQHSGRRMAHNLYLGIAAEQGLFGIACFLAILYLTMRDLNTTRRRFANSDPQASMMAAAFLVAMISYMASGMFADFSYVRYFWMMLALANASVLIANRSPAGASRSVEASQPA